MNFKNWFGLDRCLVYTGVWFKQVFGLDRSFVKTGVWFTKVQSTFNLT